MAEVRKIFEMNRSSVLLRLLNYFGLEAFCVIGRNVEDSFFGRPSAIWSSSQFAISSLFCFFQSLGHSSGQLATGRQAFLDRLPICILLRASPSRFCFFVLPNHSFESMTSIALCNPVLVHRLFGGVIDACSRLSHDNGV